MKLITPLLLATSLLANSLYIGTHLGYADKNSLDDKLSLQKISYDKTFEADIAIGYQINSFRVEIEAAKLYKTISALEENNIRLKAEGTIRQNSYLLNGYYDATNHSKFITSFGIGVGFSSVSLKDYQLLQNPTTTITANFIPTAQASLAIGYKTTQNLTTEIKYRYISTLDFKLQNEEVKALNDHLFMLGVRYNF